MEVGRWGSGWVATCLSARMCFKGVVLILFWLLMQYC